MKKTKIVCSMGPASLKLETLCEMVKKGMNVARINCSHADIKNREETVKLIHEARKITGENIAILYDTKGPEFRNDTLKCDNDFNELWEYNLKGLLKEYLRGSRDQKSILEKLKKAYDIEVKSDESEADNKNN